VISAYVEITFDNSDGSSSLPRLSSDASLPSPLLAVIGRIPIETEEVVLRRTIGQKKDEFFLNRKRIQKSEVVSLLESAGFSKSNPYYIVQQGKVANLCVMKDRDRLNLLKEIAGTSIYEERRAESVKIMTETVGKQERIEEVLTFIEERLSELEKEKEELTEFDLLDKRRRALQSTIYDKEYSKVT
jgi:structural maintenance of chromosome 3 (chondroitin sulfate proteoglycan 6)